jgi:chromosome partitioning protein
MTVTIVVSNQKGGVGKTMFAVHLAEYCAERAKVLFVDVDGQGNSTRFFLDDRAKPGKGASRLFSDGEAPEIIKVRENLAIIPADKTLNDVEAAPLEVIMLPRRHLAACAAGYDVVIIDTPPSQGRRLLGALIAANAVVTPLGLDKASFEGIEDLLNDIKVVRAKMNPSMRHIGILINRFKPANKEQRANLRALQADLGDRVLSTVLQDRSPVGTAFDNRKPIWKRSKGESAQRAAHEFRAACELVYTRATA